MKNPHFIPIIKMRWLQLILQQLCLLFLVMGIAKATPAPFTIVVKTNNEGVTTDNQFKLPLYPGAIYNFTVEWGDKTSTTVTNSTSPTHTYATPGNYTLKIRENVSGGFPRIYFNGEGDRAKLIAITRWGGGRWQSMSGALNGCYNMKITAWDGLFAKTEMVTDYSNAWAYCSNMTSFPFLNTSEGTNFAGAWFACNKLVNFPKINTKRGVDFSYTWSGCSSLGSFPLLDTARGTNFNNTWIDCSSLTNFPLLNTAEGTNFRHAWHNCSSLRSFPLLNTAKGTNFEKAWSGCSSLTSFPLLNTAAGTNFESAWSTCANLTSFPLLNTASGTNFNGAWAYCSSLRSFPLLNTAVGTDFTTAWSACVNLTSFPLLNTSKGIFFTGAWMGCQNLTSFPLLNTAAGTDFKYAWAYCFRLTHIANISLGNMKDGLGCFIYAPLSVESYSKLLISIGLTNRNNNIVFYGSEGKYNQVAVGARKALTDRGWIITDGGLATP